MIQAPTGPARQSPDCPAAVVAAAGAPATRTHPDVSVIVVTYNSAAHIAACLGALPDACRGHTYEVVVIDNASSDGTRGIVRGARPDTNLLSSDTNLGFARANNEGIRTATGDKVLVLNPDTVAAPGSIDRLVSLLDADPRIGIVAPRLLNVDGSDQLTARAFPTISAALLGRRSLLTRLWPYNRWSSRYLIGRDQSGPGPFPVDWVSGACLMIRRDLAERTGGFDDAFFLYWEDADWCRRVKATGALVVCEPRAEVVHDEGAQRHQTWHQVWLFHQSAYRYVAKHHLAKRARVLRPLAWAALAARAAVVLAVSHASHASAGSRT